MKNVDFLSSVYIISPVAPIAQLDNALPSEGRDCGFESRWVRHDRVKEGDFMRYLLTLCCILSISGVCCAQSTKEKCIADEDMVWVESNRECIPKNPCKIENSQYCSFYQPHNITSKVLYEALIKLYARVRHNIPDCKPIKLSDIHYACASDENYVVFMSTFDIEYKDPESTDDKTQKSTDEKHYHTKKEMKDALVEICKVLGGDPTDDLRKPDTKNPSYGRAGGCTRVSDDKCELIGSVNTYEFGQKVCPLYDLEEILNIKLEKLKEY